MSEPIRIWLEISHHAAFRVGGWAFVRADGGQVTGQVMGQAGGERRIDAERAGLIGLIAALKDAPKKDTGGGPIQLHTASALAAAVPARIAAAQAGEAPPADNLDLWAQAMTALAATPVKIVRAPPAPGTPTAFAAAWADLAREKAKDKGPFVSAIPKPNLAKAGVPY